LLIGPSVPQSISPQIGGGINQFDGGISSVTTAAGPPPTPCAQDGLDFTKSCNAVLYVVIFH
jgi:hypothetical protein